MTDAPLIVNPSRLISPPPNNFRFPPSNIPAFGTIEVGEADVFSINACKHIGFTAGEQITGAAWSCWVSANPGSGSDPNAENCLIRSSYSGAILSVLASDFLAGVTYTLEVTFTTTVPGVIRKLSGSVAAIPAAAPPPPSEPSSPASSELAFDFTQPTWCSVFGAAPPPVVIPSISFDFTQPPNLWL